jgi:tRNA/rRNA methyltransferase
LRASLIPTLNNVATIIFVLVRPAVPENVGAAARALKTMGFDQLRIVGSNVHRDKPAHILAHASTDILDNAREFSDLDSALADIDFCIGTSAKIRHDKRYNLMPAQLRDAIAEKGASVNNVAIVFGCEESGLSNSELALCDALTTIPLATSYPSLNLAQSVMLYAYELSQLQADVQIEAAELSEWRALKQRVGKLLDALEVPAEGKLRDWTLERLALAGADDVGFLHMLCRHVENLQK